MKPHDIYRCERLTNNNIKKKINKCFGVFMLQLQKYMNGIEERTGCQVTSVKRGRCRWKDFILLTSEERVVQSQSKEAEKKKDPSLLSVSTEALNVAFLKDFAVLKRPFLASL